MGSRVLDGERSDGLKFAAVVKLEVLFFQAGDDFAARIADDNAHQNVVHPNFESCWSVLTRNFLNFARRSFLRGLGGGIRISDGRGSGRRRVLRRRVLPKERAGQGCQGQETAGQKSKWNALGAR